MPKPGLSDLSNETSKVIKDGNLYKKYSVLEEVIDLAPLKDRLASLEGETPPSDNEVLELAKRGETHPYYNPNRRFEIDGLKDQITKLESL